MPWYVSGLIATAMSRREFEHPRTAATSVATPTGAEAAADNTFGGTRHMTSDETEEHVIADQQQLYAALRDRYLSNADSGRHGENDRLIYELRLWKRQRQGE